MDPHFTHPPIFRELATLSSSPIASTSYKYPTQSLTTNLQLLPLAFVPQGFAIFRLRLKYQPSPNPKNAHPPPRRHRPNRHPHPPRLAFPKPHHHSPRPQPHLPHPSPRPRDHHRLPSKPILHLASHNLDPDAPRRRHHRTSIRARQRLSLLYTNESAASNDRHPYCGSGSDEEAWYQTADYDFGVWGGRFE